MTVAVERLRELLSCDQETGTLRWRVDGKRMKPRAGAIAGCKDPRGYVQVRVDGRLYWGHRVVMALTHGQWPLGEVDHIDGDKGNNKPSNLRAVTKATNMQNLRRAMASNKSSGLLGAHWCKANRKWKAAITVHGRTKYLGLFESAEAAHTAYVEAKRQLHAGGML